MPVLSHLPSSMKGRFERNSAIHDAGDCKHVGVESVEEAIASSTARWCPCCNIGRQTMSKRKEKPEQISPPDSMTKTSKKGSVELTEDELDKASGGQLVHGNSKWGPVTLKRG